MPDSHSTPAPDGLPADCQAVTSGVAFFALSRMAEWVSPDDDARIATFLMQVYAMAAEHLVPAGGRIVKFMGDGGLAVFPPESTGAVVGALAGFARAARACGAQSGIDVYLNASVHVGPVLAGSFGAPGREQFDVIGKAVNIAARLGRRGILLSPQAFRCMSETARAQFDKVRPPVVYRYRWPAE
jgi:class 3 adenylate cyclase